MSLPYKKDNVFFARQLRKNATPQENHLWYDFLSGYPLRFQRQKCIDGYIVDFYCHKAKIVIEIDGSQHYTEAGKIKDDFRTEKLEEYDLTVLRFTNRQIDTKFREVCNFIDRMIRISLDLKS